MLSGLALLVAVLAGIARRLARMSRELREHASAIDVQRDVIAAHERAVEVARVELRQAVAEAERANELAAAEVRERIRTQERLQQSQKLEAVGRLAGGIAHDFNNLLTVARTYCDLLIEELPQGDTKRDDLLEIRAATERASALSRRLLAFGRKQVYAPSVMHLGDVVESLESMFVRTLPESITLRVHLARHLPPIVGDAGQLEQVIMNLVLNAVDAMPDGGTITVATAPEASPSAGEPADSASGAFVRLTVRDTGTGIDAETQQHVFEPFFTTKEPGKGTGLGLSTVYEIVEQHGGVIRVHSEVGRGTMFTVVLPAAPDGAVVAATPSARTVTPPRGGPRGTVLVIDPDPALVASLTRALAVRGYHVIGVQSQGDALESARGHPGPMHVVVADMATPGWGPERLIGTLRELRPEATFLVMSGGPSDAVRRMAEERDLAFVQKPFSLDDLVGAVELLLSERRAHRGRARSRPSVG